METDSEVHMPPDHLINSAMTRFHYPNHDHRREFLQTSQNMAKSGKTTQIWQSHETTIKTEQPKVIDMLKELGEFRISGVITE